MNSENFERFILAFYSLSEAEQERALTRMEAHLAASAEDKHPLSHQESDEQG